MSALDRPAITLRPAPDTTEEQIREDERLSAPSEQAILERAERLCEHAPAENADFGIALAVARRELTGGAR